MSAGRDGVEIVGDLGPEVEDLLLEGGEGVFGEFNDFGR